MAMIAISMRMTQHSYPGGGREIRDALAQDWWRFLEQALPDVMVAPLPNMGRRTVSLVRELPISGLILSGGDDWGVFPERDATEKELVRWAESLSLPIVGVCRGAQVINRLRGGNTSPGFGPDHAGARHAVHVKPCAGVRRGLMSSREVNSYHNYGIRPADLAPGLTPWALAEDGSVEAFCSADGRVTGIMWHPEREARAQAQDIHLFQALKRGKA